MTDSSDASKHPADANRHCFVINQKDLMRDLIELRGKFLESKTYEDFVSYLDILNSIFENSTDKRLSEILSNLIDQVSSFREERFDIKKSTKEVETRVID